MSGRGPQTIQSSTQAAKTSRPARNRTREKYPVVDLFAGPGGLGEGFASALDEKGVRRFSAGVAIERDEFSHATLVLRHFLRQFRDGEAPDAYYSFLAGGITREQLYARYPQQFQHATMTALRISLGPDSHTQVRQLIRKRLVDQRRWVLVGGPPCQAYSLVGRSRMMGRADFEQDERHTLYMEYLRIISDHRPPVFVMENVKGLLSATIEGKSAIGRILSDLAHPARAIPGGPKDLSYRLFSLSEKGEAGTEVDPRRFIVRAEDHGIPQARHRMFIVGVRSDLKVQPETLKRMNAPTVQQTIGSLPPVRSGLSKDADSHAAWLEELQSISSLNIKRQLNGASYTPEMVKALSPRKILALRTPQHSSSSRYPVRLPKHEILRGLVDNRLSVLTAHEARSHMASDLRRYLYAATFAELVGRSPKLSDFPAALLPKHQNVELGRTGKMFSDRFRVQLADNVSTTITSHISKDGHYFIHYDPTQCRSLTVREAARLQTFPDNYFFAGPRTAQYHQIGNAVPPSLARQIAQIVGDVLDSIGDAA